MAKFATSFDVLTMRGDAAAGVSARAAAATTTLTTMKTTTRKTAITPICTV